MWRTPGTIYLDTQLIDKDVYVYSGSEMFVEPLDRPEPMKSCSLVASIHTDVLILLNQYVRW